LTLGSGAFGSLGMASFVRRTRRALVKSEYGSMVPVADAVTPGNSRTRRTMSKIKRRESAGVS
jgi:hypothetical protein